MGDNVNIYFTIIYIYAMDNVEKGMLIVGITLNIIALLCILLKYVGGVCAGDSEGMCYIFNYAAVLSIFFIIIEVCIGAVLIVCVRY